MSTVYHDCCFLSIIVEKKPRIFYFPFVDMQKLSSRRSFLVSRLGCDNHGDDCENQIHQ